MPISRLDQTVLRQVKIMLQDAIGVLKTQDRAEDLMALYQGQSNALEKIAAALDTAGPLLRSPVNGGWYTEAEVKQDHDTTEQVG